MFKNGEAAEIIARQGAGAYLGGTATYDSRIGNKKDGIKHPFINLPKSHSAINWLGLPNWGISWDYRKNEHLIKKKISQVVHINQQYNCPIGWSIAANPEAKDYHKIEDLGILLRTVEHSGADFIEINESCPNTEEKNEGIDYLTHRLKRINEESNRKFLKKNIPLIVKFSNDVKIEQIPYLMDILIDLKFDGINFGNTSIDYSNLRNKINENEKRDFDYFTKTFGGGLSGRLLKEKSLELCEAVVEYREKIKPNFEFHVIRTGGIENAQDILDSENAGVSMNQWFIGYWENFKVHRHRVYEKLYQDLLK